VDRAREGRLPETVVSNRADAAEAVVSDAAAETRKSCKYKLVYLIA
jgi:hypothetical protein